MAWKGKYSSIAPEDIRSESLTFEQALIRQIDRINMTATFIFSGSATSRGRAILNEEQMILKLEAMVAPYSYNIDEFKAMIGEIEKLKNPQYVFAKDLGHPRQYLNYLNKRYAWIITNLGTLNILPPISTIVVAGQGEVPAGYGINDL